MMLKRSSAPINESIVDLEDDTSLRFIIHWHGGCHMRFEMPKPLSGALEDLELTNMARRYRDDEIARVLSNTDDEPAR